MVNALGALANIRKGWLLGATVKKTLSSRLTLSSGRTVSDDDDAGAAATTDDDGGGIEEEEDDDDDDDGGGNGDCTGVGDGSPK